MVSAWHVCCTRGSGIVSGAADVIWMSVVRGMRGVGEVCEMCMCLARRWRGGSVDARIGFGLYQPCEIRGSVGRVFGLRGWVWGLDHGLEGWDGVMSM